MLSELISRRRKEKWLTQSQLARMCGHPVSTIHGLENGLIKNPRFEIIIDISEVLGISLDEMKNAFKARGKEEQNEMQ